jgi:ABC-type multidrug transport system fused ATPase/permease subunit
VFSLFVYISICIYISVKLTLFSAIIVPVFYFSLRVLIQKIRSLSDVYATDYSDMGTKISNALSCMMLVKAYAYEETEKQRFSMTSDRVRDSQFNIDKKQLLVSPFQELVGLCMLMFLVGFVAFLFVKEGTGDVARFMVFFVVLRKGIPCFGVFSRMQAQLAGLRGPIKAIEDMFSDEEKFLIPEGDKAFPGLEKNIEVKDFNFSYLKGRQIFSGLNLTVKKNEVVAIVGPSGSGKTTLINLLMRFYDVPSGKIFLDGTDIKEFTIKSIRDKIALVSQETLLLNASFRSNLIYGLERDVPETELRDVLERARLSDLFRHIGLDGLIGERGVKLSGGEKQRLSIARAMLKNPEILILDEATSALDTATEILVRDALEEIVVGRTALVIAHRLATIRHADRIVVLDKGGIVEEGTFEVLVANQEGRFYSYWQAQKLESKNRKSGAQQAS